MPVRLDDKIFDKVERRSAISSLITRSAKEFKQLTKDKMIYGRATGRVYDKGRGVGFTRSHRASAAGQRPAPDTLTLVNAIDDRRLSDYSSEVYIADKINTSNGTVASDYGSILQNKLDRPIMSDTDVAEAQAKIERDSLTMIESLTRRV